jgi:ribosome biogenesis GTPase A
MERTKRLLTSYLPHLNLVLELADARAPKATRWPSLDAMLGHVPRVLLLNKEDLADPAVTRLWLERLAAQTPPLQAIAVSAGGPAARGREAGTVRAAIKAARPEGLRVAQKVAVVGVPNVGKSALINLIAGRRRAPSGAKPGLTRGKQWVVVSPDLWVLDLPGVLPPSPRDNREVACLALTGTLPEGAYDVLEVGLEFAGLVLETAGADALAAMLDLGPLERPRAGAAAGEAAGSSGKVQADALGQDQADALGLDQVRALELDQAGKPTAGPGAWLAAFARRRGLLGPNGEPQVDQAAQILIADFRRGRLGRLSLERPDDDAQA